MESQFGTGDHSKLGPRLLSGWLLICAWPGITHYRTPESQCQNKDNAQGNQDYTFILRKFHHKTVIGVNYWVHYVSQIKSDQAMDDGNFYKY